MSDLVDRLSVLQALLAERHPDHHATVCEAIAEVRRLRGREAKAREILQAHADEYERTDTDDGVLRAAERLGIWMASKRWLEAE